MSQIATCSARENLKLMMYKNDVIICVPTTYITILEFYLNWEIYSETGFVLFRGALLKMILYAKFLAVDVTALCLRSFCYFYAVVLPYETTECDYGYG